MGFIFSGITVLISFFSNNKIMVACPPYARKEDSWVALTWKKQISFKIVKWAVLHSDKITVLIIGFEWQMGPLFIHLE